MEKTTNSVEHTGIKYGLLTCLGLIGYFLVMQAVDLGHIIELRFLNFIILAYGIYFGIMRYKNEHPDEDIYFKGLAEGALICLVAVVPFATFVSLYLEYIDVGLMNEIRQSVPISGYVNGISTFAVVSLEGVGSGMIITYATMQYFSSASRKAKKEVTHDEAHVES